MVIILPSQQVILQRLYALSNLTSGHLINPITPFLLSLADREMSPKEFVDLLVAEFQKLDGNLRSMLEATMWTLIRELVDEPSAAAAATLYWTQVQDAALEVKRRSYMGRAQVNTQP